MGHSSEIPFIGNIEDFARIQTPNQCLNFKVILNFRLAFGNLAEVDKIPPHNYNESIAIVNSKERILCYGRRYHGDR